MTEKPPRAFPVVGPDRFLPPDYGRVVRQLAVDDLRAEVAAGRGETGYQEAARAELARRDADDAGRRAHEEEARE